MSLGKDLGGDFFEALKGGDASIMGNGVDSAGHFGAAETWVVTSTAVDALEYPRGGYWNEGVEDGELIGGKDFGFPPSLFQDGDYVLSS